jgi:uncharacterized phage protein (TIGR02220 family)
MTKKQPPIETLESLSERLSLLQQVVFEELEVDIEKLTSRVMAVEDALRSLPSKMDVTNVPGKSLDDHVAEILDKINVILGTRFKPVSANLRYLRSRVAEKTTVEEMLDVAKLKKAQWGADPDMRKYLRIETLYNATKFQSYLAEVDQAKQRDAMYDELR